jgi:SPP1 family predicted phage head-tail adaptor
MRFNKKEEIGKLRERILVEQVTRSASTTGYPAETWTTLDTVWGMVDYKGINREDVDGGKITAKSQIRVTCRYRTDITESMRITYINKKYQIENIQISEDNLYLILFCSYNENYQ